jgi:hypothetical protein
MTNSKPSDILRLAISRTTEADAYFTERREIFLKNLETTEDDKPVFEALRQYIEEMTEIILTAEQAESLVRLYPRVVAALFEWGVEDTSTEQAVNDMLAESIVGADYWPRDSDKIDMAAWVALLKREAAAMGYAVAPGRNKLPTHVEPTPSPLMPSTLGMPDSESSREHNLIVGPWRQSLSVL